MVQGAGQMKLTDTAYCIEWCLVVQGAWMGDFNVQGAGTSLYGVLWPVKFNYMILMISGEV